MFEEMSTDEAPGHSMTPGLLSTGLQGQTGGTEECEWAGDDTAHRGRGELASNYHVVTAQL